MVKVVNIKPEQSPVTNSRDHEAYGFVRRDLVPGGQHCRMACYEIPPGKSNYPFHYHTEVEECFYILRGKGLLKTPEGEAAVEAGDFLFFPACEEGAHKLTNVSETEMLVYLDFDTCHPMNVCVYPDSGKVGIWGMGIRQLFYMDSQVGYYDGE